jgi:hypothetical protein
VLVPGAAVSAVGVPVNDGEFMVALSAISDVFVVILAVLAAIEIVLVVILEVLAATDVGNVAIVEELTPPTLFTVGKSAVPPKSFVNLSLPFVDELASGVAEELIPD